MLAPGTAKKPNELRLHGTAECHDTVRHFVYNICHSTKLLAINHHLNVSREKCILQNGGDVDLQKC